MASVQVDKLVVVTASTQRSPVVSDGNSAVVEVFTGIGSSVAGGPPMSWQNVFGTSTTFTFFLEVCSRPIDSHKSSWGLY